MLKYLLVYPRTVDISPSLFLKSPSSVGLAFRSLIDRFRVASFPKMTHLKEFDWLYPQGIISPFRPVSMNDFFTELDSDLLGVERIVKNAKILPVTVQPRTPVTTVQPRTPAVADVQKTPVPLPVTIPQTPRVVREMREPREENISNFSLTNSPVSIFPTMKQPQSLPSLPKGQTRVMAIG